MWALGTDVDIQLMRLLVMMFVLGPARWRWPATRSALSGGCGARCPRLKEERSAASATSLTAGRYSRSPARYRPIDADGGTSALEREDASPGGASGNPAGNHHDPPKGHPGTAPGRPNRADDVVVAQGDRDLPRVRPGRPQLHSGPARVQVRLRVNEACKLDLSDMAQNSYSYEGQGGRCSSLRSPVAVTVGWGWGHSSVVRCWMALWRSSSVGWL